MRQAVTIPAFMFISFFSSFLLLALYNTKVLSSAAMLPLPRIRKKLVLLGRVTQRSEEFI